MNIYEGALRHWNWRMPIAAATDLLTPSLGRPKPLGRAWLCAVLKLHRTCSCGEVSIALVQPQQPANLLIAGFGTAFAIITLL
jgi:hypothetical protein